MTNQKKTYYKKENVKPNRKTNKPVSKGYKGGYNRPKYNSLEKIVKSRREETLDDIKGDIERLEKEIEFEIKQIQSAKLGL